jgi:hypothetical protein
MCDALFLIAGVSPILTKRDFGAYQLESKDFWEARGGGWKHRGSICRP